jgi:Pentapeptide repeats (9 copies)
MSDKDKNIADYLVDSNRIEQKDQAIRQNIEDADWSNIQFLRLVAIGKKFKNVNFSNTTFDACYLRNCQFDSCNFTGARFSGSNLHGANFAGCRFDYALFERTIIDESILKNNCPAFENQKMWFARSLRTNFQQTGNSRAVNLAIRVELEATETHLRKSWKSNDHYYRTKYSSLASRIGQFASWAKFKCLDYIWGNGESVGALFRSVVVLLLAVTAFDLSLSTATLTWSEFGSALWRAPQILFGVTAPEYISPGWLTLATALRFVMFGFFMSIIIKRYNRR